MMASFEIPEAVRGCCGSPLCALRRGSTPRLWGAAATFLPQRLPVAQRALGGGALTLASLSQVIVGGNRPKLADVLHEGPLLGNQCQRHAGRPSMSGLALCLCREKSRPDAGCGGGPIKGADGHGPVSMLRQPDNHHSAFRLCNQPPRLFHQSRGKLFHVKPVSFRQHPFHAPRIGRKARNGNGAGGQ